MVMAELTLRRLCVIAAVLTVVSSGCERRPDPSAPSTPAPGGPRLAAPVQQDRLDATRRMVTVPLTSPRAVTVESVQLAGPYFAVVPAVSFGQPLAAGGRIDFPVGYGAAQCGAKAGRTIAVVTVRPGGTVRLPVTGDALGRLWRADCVQQHLEAAFTVTWSGPWRRLPASPGQAQRLGGTLRLALTTTQASVEVTGLRGSVLYDLAGTGTGHARLGGRQSTLGLPVELGVRLCSKHGLTEAKKTFVFSMYARLNGGAPQVRTIEPPAAVQKDIAALLATCPDTD
jgi:hypothetical protein